MKKVRISTEYFKGMFSSPSSCTLPVLSVSFYLPKYLMPASSISMSSEYLSGVRLLLIAASLTSKAFHAFVKRYKRYINWIEVTGIVFLIITAVVIVTNNLTGLSGYFAKWFLFLNQMS